MPKAIHTIELCLTDEQVEAIRRKHREHDKKRACGCGFVDLGDVSACGGDLAQAERRDNVWSALKRLRSSASLGP
jgi:hypothetical protein